MVLEALLGPAKVLILNKNGQECPLHIAPAKTTLHQGGVEITKQVFEACLQRLGNAQGFKDFEFLGQHYGLKVRDVSIAERVSKALPKVSLMVASFIFLYAKLNHPEHFNTLLGYRG